MSYAFPLSLSPAVLPQVMLAGLLRYYSNPTVPLPDIIIITDSLTAVR
jgi:hypothetical protein